MSVFIAELFINKGAIILKVITIECPTPKKVKDTYLTTVNLL